MNSDLRVAEITVINRCPRSRCRSRAEMTLSQEFSTSVIACYNSYREIGAFGQR